MQITRDFTLPFPPAQVWRALSDVHLVAQCLPGAELREELGADRYKGRFTVKLGPLAAGFDGEVEIARDAAAQSATVTGKGSDARSASRASGSMTYRLSPEGEGTRVQVESTLNLAGALAQFGKAGVIQDIATRITASFVENLRTRLAAEAPPPPAPPEPLAAGVMLFSVLRAWLRRLFGR